jgi:hypothetical protein
MRTISSGLTIFVKWGSPVLVAGALILVAVDGPATAAHYWWPALLGVIFFAVHALTAAQLADAVFDCGDHLLVRKGSASVKVPLLQINTITEGLMLVRNAPAVVITLGAANELGKSFSFLPVKHSLSGGYARVGVASHLRLRVERSKEQNAV